MNSLILFWFASIAFFDTVVAEDCVNCDKNSREAVDELLDSISQKKGLYHDFPFVKTLDLTNFDTEVRGKRHSWVIEFYSSWCGHCMRFMTTFKRFAADVHGWHPLVKIGAVDCSAEVNVPLCRHFLVEAYPTVRFLPPAFTRSTFGTTIPQGTVPFLRQSVLHLLLTQTVVGDIRRFEGGLDELAAANAEGTEFVVLIIECDPASTTGPEIALDYSAVVSVLVVPVSCNGHRLFTDLRIPRPAASAMYVLNINGLQYQQVGTDGILSRNEAKNVLRDYFLTQNVRFEIPVPFNISSIRNIKIDNDAILRWNLKRSTESKPVAHLTDTVFQVDLEATLKHTFSVEIPMKGLIAGDAFKALLSYVDVLKKYFPIGSNGKAFLSYVSRALRSYNAINGISGLEFDQLVVGAQKRFEPVFLEYRPGWIGCRGSVPFFRGFPCGLWQMFHALTVQGMIRNSQNPLEVLNSMEGYLAHFFGCSDCARHFAQMAVTSRDVSSNEGSVLWLWGAHNVVNERLRGDRTEDPNYPKVQFPTPRSCPKCHEQNGNFHQFETLEFLRTMYSNISYVPLDVTSHHGLVHGQRTWQSSYQILPSQSFYGFMYG